MPVSSRQIRATQAENPKSWVKVRKSADLGPWSCLAHGQSDEGRGRGYSAKPDWADKTAGNGTTLETIFGPRPPHRPAPVPPAPSPAGSGPRTGGWCRATGQAQSPAAAE